MRKMYKLLIAMIINIIILIIVYNHFIVGAPFNDNKVYINDVDYKYMQLEFNYFDNEKALCIYSYDDGKTLTVSEGEDMIGNSETVTLNCPNTNEYMGTFHTHNNFRCTQSELDKTALLDDRFAIIMCGNDRFSIYENTNGTINRVKVEIIYE